MWTVWQLADSAFPSGSFAHSAGLEAAVQLGEVRDDADLDAFLEDALWQTGLAALPFATASHRAPETLPQIDTRSDAFLVSRVANRASRAQGRALAAAATEVFASAPLAELARRVEARETPAHLAPITGAVLHHAGLDLATTQRLVLFTSARSTLTAAVRLGLLGPTDAQRRLHQASPLLDRVLGVCAERSLDEVAQPAPRLELVASLHDRLYSRLFQS